MFTLGSMESLSIGVIGAGLIGGPLAVPLAGLGHRVRIANSKDPSTLTQFAGVERLTPSWAADAAAGADVVIVSVPENRVAALCAQLAPKLTDDAVVIDTGNHYPNRDGRSDELDNGTPDSVWVAGLLGRPVYKAFNSIIASSLKHNGTHDRAGRIGLAVAGPAGPGKDTVFGLVDQLGFEPVDAGPLADSWRQQPGTPSYCQDFDADRLRAALAATTSDGIAEYHRRRDRITDFAAAAADVAARM